MIDRILGFIYLVGLTLAIVFVPLKAIPALRRRVRALKEYHG